MKNLKQIHTFWHKTFLIFLFTIFSCSITQAGEQYSSEHMYSLGEFAHEVQTNGTIVYHRKEAGISAYDVVEGIEGEEIILINKYESDVHTIGFYVDEQYIYLLDQNLNITILDISDPYFMNKVATFQLPLEKQPYTPLVVINKHNNYLYFAFASSTLGINIIDISNPEAPLFVKTISEDTFSSKIYNNHLFTVSFNYPNQLGGLLKIWSLNQPENPVKIAEVAYRNAYPNINISSNLIYLCGFNNEGYDIVNIEDYNNPFLANSYTNNSFSMLKSVIWKDFLIAFTLEGSTSYISSYNINDPLNPVLISKVASTSISDFIIFKNKIFVMHNSDDFLKTFDLNNTGIISEEFCYKAICMPGKFHKTNNYLTILSWHMAWIYEVSNGFGQVQKGTIRYSDFNESDAISLTQDNTDLCILYPNSNYHLYDISDPENIVLLSKFPAPNVANSRMVLKDKVLYVLVYISETERRFEVIDFNNYESPRLVHSEELKCWDICFSEDKNQLYISFFNQDNKPVEGKTNGVIIYDIANKTQPQKLQSFATREYSSLKEYNNVLYVGSNNDYPETATNSWLEAYSITDGAQPVLLASVSEEKGIWDIDAAEGVIGVTRMTQGVDFYSTYTPQSNSLKSIQNINVPELNKVGMIFNANDYRDLIMSFTGGFLFNYIYNSLKPMMGWKYSFGSVETHVSKWKIEEPQKVKLSTGIVPAELNFAGASISPSGTTSHTINSNVTITTSISNNEIGKHYKLKGYRGASGNGNSTSVLMDADKTVIAVYEKIKYYLNASPNNLNAKADSDLSNSFTIDSNIDWNIFVDHPWCKVSVTSGSGGATVSVTINENILFKEREAEIIIEAVDKDLGVADVSIKVNQTAAKLKLNPSTKTIPLPNKKNSTATFSIESNTDWRIESDEDFYLIRKTNGLFNTKSSSPTKNYINERSMDKIITGTGDATFEITTTSTNESTEARIGYITLSTDGLDDQKIELVQYGADLFLSVSESKVNLLPDSLNYQDIEITSNANWTINCDQDWLSISCSSGTGDSTIRLTATENKNITERMAIVTLSIAGLDDLQIEVTQKGKTIVLKSSDSALLFSANTSNTKSIIITSNTNWQAGCEADWLWLNNKSGTGNGNIEITASENINTEARTASITLSANGINDQTIVVTQEGATPLLSVSLSEINLQPSTNNNQTFDIISNTNWTVISDAEWLQFNVESGKGDATVTLLVQENNTNELRNSVITISADDVEDVTIKVIQNYTTGLFEYNVKGVNIYPNPCFEQVTIQSDFVFHQIEINDIPGNTISCIQANSKSIKIELDNYKPGIYLLIIKGNQQQKVKKIIVK